MVNSRLWRRPTSPSRKQCASWKMGPEPAASSRFMANSGEVCSQSRSRPAGVTAWAESDARCRSVLPPWPSTGVSTSSTPRSAKKARTSASSRARSRSSPWGASRRSFPTLLNDAGPARRSWIYPAMGGASQSRDESRSYREVVNRRVLERSSPADVLAGPGIHLQHFALVDKERHADHGTGGEGCRLGAALGGVALEARVGLGNFQLDEVGRSHADGVVVPQGHGIDHLLLEPLDGVAQGLLLHRVLLEGAVGLHEVPHLTVGVEVLHVQVHHVGALEGLP